MNFRTQKRKKKWEKQNNNVGARCKIRQNKQPHENEHLMEIKLDEERKRENILDENQMKTERGKIH